MTQKIGYIIGSLSSTSINRSLARALVRLAPKDVTLVEIPIGDLPLYNRDLDADFPPVAKKLKDAIAEAEGVIIVTPEYGRSIPGALKNALDWSSRPYGTNAFAKKPVATIGASVGAIGTAVAQQHLKTILLNFDAFVLAQPEAFIHSAPGLISSDGDVSHEETTVFLTGYVKAFSAFVREIQRGRVA